MVGSKTHVSLRLPLVVIGRHALCTPVIIHSRRLWDARGGHVRGAFREELSSPPRRRRLRSDLSRRGRSCREPTRPNRWTIAEWTRYVKCTEWMRHGGRLKFPATVVEPLSLLDATRPALARWCEMSPTWAYFFLCPCRKVSLCYRRRKNDVAKAMLPALPAGQLFWIFCCSGETGLSLAPSPDKFFSI